MVSEVEASLYIFLINGIDWTRSSHLSPLPSRHNRSCRSSRSLHSSAPLGMTEGWTNALTYL